MDFSDEHVIELRKNRMKEEYCDIKTGFFLDGEVVKFESQIIYQEKMSILLPEGFITMPKKIAKVKYPSEYRPQVIKTDDTGMVNMTFNLFDRNILPQQIKGATQTIKKGIRNMYPANIFFEEEMFEMGDTVCCWFDYKSHAMDGAIYNLLYVTSIEGKVLQGTFNCRFVKMNVWREAVIQMVHSITDLTKREA
ncbi:MAG: hypothetical protein NC412_00105 [Roseburia sp.]|nr:hypothetical protein [Roseburia sp.]MCM1277783.1 hypothetical protein [Robinsoniella sp.]